MIQNRRQYRNCLNLKNLQPFISKLITISVIYKKNQNILCTTLSGTKKAV